MLSDTPNTTADTTASALPDRRRKSLRLRLKIMRRNPMTHTRAGHRTAVGTTLPPTGLLSDRRAVQHLHGVPPEYGWHGPSSGGNFLDVGFRIAFAQVSPSSENVYVSGRRGGWACNVTCQRLRGPNL